MKLRIESLTHELCEEIDYLKQQLEHSKSQEQYWKDEFCKLQNSCLDDHNKTMGIILTGLVTRKNF